MKTDKSQKYLYNYRPFLEAVCEDAFFRNVDEVTMLAPDGKKTKLAVADLRALSPSYRKCRKWTSEAREDAGTY